MRVPLVVELARFAVEVRPDRRAVEHAGYGLRPRLTTRSTFAPCASRAPTPGRSASTRPARSRLENADDTRPSAQSASTSVRVATRSEARRTSGTTQPTTMYRARANRYLPP